MSDIIKDPKLILAMQELGRGLKSPSDLAKLSRELLKITVEASLNAEMDNHTGYEKHSPDGYNTGNSCNGYNRKTLKGDPWYERRVIATAASNPCLWRKIKLGWPNSMIRSCCSMPRV